MNLLLQNISVLYLFMIKQYQGVELKGATIHINPSTSGRCTPLLPHSRAVDGQSEEEKQKSRMSMGKKKKKKKKKMVRFPLLKR